MEIQKMVLGVMQVNCYLLWHKGKAALIDPGAQAKTILDLLDRKNLTLTDIFLTHGHFDHIGAVGELKEETGAIIHVHKLDAAALTDPKRNLSVVTGEDFVCCKPDVLLEDGDIISAADGKAIVLHTPGHTPGGVCYDFGDALFTGDTLFFHSIGRTDFPYSNPVHMQASLQKLAALQGNRIVYPGHDDVTDLDDERVNNPYIGALL